MGQSVKCNLLPPYDMNFFPLQDARMSIVLLLRRRSNFTSKNSPTARNLDSTHANLQVQQDAV